MERVTVTVSDPWDFVTSAGKNVVVADVHDRAQGQGAMLLRLTEPVVWHGQSWQWFVASEAPDATFSLHGVTESQALTDQWLDVPSSWRGGSPVARAEVLRG